MAANLIRSFAHFISLPISRFDPPTERIADGLPKRPQLVALPNCVGVRVSVDHEFGAVYPEPQEHVAVIAPGVAVLAGAVEALAVADCIPAAVDANGLLEGIFHEFDA